MDSNHENIPIIAGPTVFGVNRPYDMARFAVSVVLVKGTEHRLFFGEPREDARVRHVDSQQIKRSQQVAAHSPWRRATNNNKKTQNETTSKLLVHAFKDATWHMRLQTQR